jgi:hypothetical protein
MGAEVLEYQVVSSQAEAAINRMQSGAANLSKGFANFSGGSAIEGFALRSERAVSRSAANMATAFLSINDPIQGVAQGLLAIEHSTKLGLGIAVGLAVGIAAFEQIKKQVDETQKARETLEKSTSKPLALTVDLNPADIAAEIENIGKQIDDLEKKAKLPGNKIWRGIVGAANFGNQGPDTNQAAIEAGEKRVKDLSDQRADAELRIADLKKEGLTVSKAQADVDKAEADFKAASSKLFTDAFKPGASQEDLFKRLAALEEIRRVTEDQTNAKDLVQQEEDSATKDIAGFQGTPREKEDFSESRNKERLENEIAILHAFGMQEEEKKKLIELDQQDASISQKKKQQSDKDFKDERETSASTAATSEVILQSQGQNFLAGVTKTREAAESRILTLQREQKNTVAGQVQIVNALLAAETQIESALGKRLSETPAHQAAREKQEAEAKRETDLGDAQIKDAADREARGATLDENNPVTQALRAQQQLERDAGVQQPGAKNGLDSLQGQDFSSLATLGGADFSSLAALGAADFSGLKALAGLQISIA